MLGFNTHCTHCSQNGRVWGFLNAKNMQPTSLHIIKAFTKVIFAFVSLKITYIHLLAIFVPEHSHLTWEVHDLLTLINSLCHITCEFPILLPYLPELSEFCHLIHRPLKGNILCFSMNYSSTSVLPSSISGWLYFFHTIEVLTYEQTYVILSWLSHFITININYVDSCPIRGFLGIKDCHVVRFFSLQTLCNKAFSCQELSAPHISTW